MFGRKFDLVKYCEEENVSLLENINKKYALPIHISKIFLKLKGEKCVMFCHGYNILEEEKQISLTFKATPFSKKIIDKIESEVEILSDSISFKFEGISEVRTRFANIEEDDVMHVSFDFEKIITG